MHLLQKKYWIFDMDGTLTIAQHDFDAIRAELGLPEGQPILESLAQLPEVEAVPLHQRLSEMELEVAKQSKPAEGVHEFLSVLQAQGAYLGILTRNHAMNIEVTLQAAGIADFFPKAYRFSRSCALPKPSPDGILKLLALWGGNTQEAVMVGDYVHDLNAGKAAEVTTLYFDPEGEFVFRDQADVCVRSFAELLS